MKRFAYTARKKTGERISGRIFAENKSDALRIIESMGCVPAHIQEEHMPFKTKLQGNSMTTITAVLKSNRDLMTAAREALTGKWGKAAWACFIYLLICIPLQFIPGLGIAIQLFITGPFMLGWAVYGLKLARGQNPDIKDMFSGFNEFGKSFGAYLLIIVYVLLWSLLLIIPGIMALYSYALTYFILSDNPDMGVNEAISTSRRLMTGNRWKYFCLCMRFFGWMILNMITFGIAMFWLWPYIQTALAEFYEDVKNT